MNKVTLKMEHFGIFCKTKQRWLTFTNGMIFWSSSRAVAQAYLDRNPDHNKDLEIRTFEPASVIILEET
jgi:hypothetical protein